MADELESKASPEQQAEAAKMGWKPPEKFRGDAEKFVDADVYLERAETVLPFVREHNKRLSGDLADLRARLEGEVAKNSDLARRLEDIDIQHSTRLAKEVKQARLEAQADLEAALEAGDHKATARLTREVAKLEAVEEEVPAKKEVTKLEVSEVDRRIMAETDAWAKENDFSTWSVRERAEFRAVSEELRSEGNRTLGSKFLDECLQHMKRESKQAEAKVESGKGSGQARGGKRTGYDALTSDERAVCDADERQFVGKGKKFETREAYRTHWAKVYQEQA